MVPMYTILIVIYADFLIEELKFNGKKIKLSVRRHHDAPYTDWVKGESLLGKYA